MVDTRDSLPCRGKWCDSAPVNPMNYLKILQLLLIRECKTTASIFRGFLHQGVCNPLQWTNIILLPSIIACRLLCCDF